MEAGLFSNQGRENRRQITSEKRENFEEKDIHTSKILKMKRESRCNLALTYLGMVYLPQVLGPSPCIFCRAYRPHPGACPTSGGEPHTNSYRTCTTSRSEYTRYPAGEMETESGSCSRVLVPSNPKFFPFVQGGDVCQTRSSWLCPLQCLLTCASVQTCVECAVILWNIGKKCHRALL